MAPIMPNNKKKNTENISFGFRWCTNVELPVLEAVLTPVRSEPKHLCLLASQSLWLLFTFVKAGISSPADREGQSCRVLSINTLGCSRTLRDDYPGVPLLPEVDKNGLGAPHGHPRYKWFSPFQRFCKNYQRNGEITANNADGWFFICSCVTSFISLREKNNNQCPAGLIRLH